MGFFKNILPKGDTPNNDSPEKISLAKEEHISKLNLKKEEVHAICLTKKPLINQKSRVALVLDYSGSMSRLYKNGTVQDVIETALPLAMEFDDNGTIEAWIFDNGFHRLPDINLSNFYGYVEREILSKYRMGGTSYAPVMKDIYKRYIQEEPSKLPNYVLFLTDGDADDHHNTNKIIKETSEHPIFWQYVGLGNSGFNYLEQLDDMTGRYVDNADFFKVSDPSKISYKDLLNEYPEWLSNPKVKAMIE